MRKSDFRSILSILFALILTSSLVLAVSQVTLSPTVVSVGNPLTITVQPDVNGTSKNGYLYMGNTFMAYVTFPCGNTCYNQTTNVTIIPTTWVNGVYNVRIFEYKYGGWSPRTYITKYFNVTGSSVIQKNTTLALSPSVVNAGAPLTISVSPGNEGSSSYVYLYMQNPYYSFKGPVALPCARGKCTSDVSINYTIPTTWLNGRYHAQVYDYTTGRNVQVFFNVTGSTAVSKNTTLQLAPETVNIGNTININIAPGSEGIYKYGYIYDALSKLKATHLLCTSSTSKCFDNIQTSYTIPTTFANGTHTFRVYDYLTYKWLQKPFNVLSSVVPNATIPFDFRIDTNPSSASAKQGNDSSTNVTVQLLSSNGTTPTVSLSISGCPPNATCFLSSMSGTPTFNSKLYIQMYATNSSAPTPPGNYTIVILGIGGGKTKYGYFNLLVLPGDSQPVANTTVSTLDFKVSLNTPVYYVYQDYLANLTVTVTLTNGTPQPVSLSVSGCPSSSICEFSQSSGNPTYKSIFTVKPNLSTLAGSYPITINGTGGGLTKSAKLNLTIRCALSLTNYPIVNISPVEQNGVAGATLVYTVTVENKDDIACGPSPFTMSWGYKPLFDNEKWTASYPNESIMICNGVKTNCYIIGPSSKIVTKLSITSPINARPENYIVQANVRNSESGKMGAANGLYIVGSGGSGGGPSPDGNVTNTSSNVSLSTSSTGFFSFLNKFFREG